MTVPSGGGLSKSGLGRHSDFLLRLAGMVEPPAPLTKAQVDWDTIVSRSRGPSDTELASVLIPFHKFQRGGKARPSALVVKALLG
jgi:hypothetical protein